MTAPEWKPSRRGWWVAMAWTITALWLARASAVHEHAQPTRSLLEYVGCALAGAWAVRSIILAAVVTSMECIKHYASIKVAERHKNDA